MAVPRVRHVVAAVLCVAVALCFPCRAARGDVTAAQVDETIKKACDFLLNQQNPAGNWETGGKGGAGHGGASLWGGHTALATYALLAGGVSSQDPRMQKAIQFLREEEINLIYAVGIRAQV